MTTNDKLGMNDRGNEANILVFLVECKTNSHEWDQKVQGEQVHTPQVACQQEQVNMRKKLIPENGRHKIDLTDVA